MAGVSEVTKTDELKTLRFYGNKYTFLLVTAI